MKILELLPWLVIVALAIVVLIRILRFPGMSPRAVLPVGEPPEGGLWNGDPPTREAVVRRVHSEYPAEADLVLSELDFYSGREPDRVKMDILILSAGSLVDLRRWTRIAYNDYRDVLSAAEYSHTEMGSEILRDFRERRPENSMEISFRDLMQEDLLEEKPPSSET